MGSLRVAGLGKAYRQYPSGRAKLAEWLGFGPRHRLHWVLRDVSLEIAPGEAVGIVGPNGAGKSTLLKLITGTTRATTGHIEVRGRVAALLELGIGFHPEFTGRENIYMSGQLHGLSRAEIDACLPAIEAFAEIGAYLDQPLRTYSSGMQVRLAFSLATAVRPDILIVDEALSVGDAYFAHKSMARIREFQRQGTTLLFVSHDPGAVKTLCDRALLLDQGAVVQDGAPDTVLDYYNALIARREADYAIRQAQAGERPATRSGDGRAQILGVEVLAGEAPARVLRAGAPATFRIALEANAALENLTVGLLLRDRLGNDVFGTNTHHLGTSLAGVAAGSRREYEFHIPALNLGAGTYSVTVALHGAETHLGTNYDWWDRAVVFQVAPGAGTAHVGLCRLPVAGRWRG